MLHEEYFRLGTYSRPWNHSDQQPSNPWLQIREEPHKHKHFGGVFPGLGGGHHFVVCVCVCVLSAFFLREEEKHINTHTHTHTHFDSHISWVRWSVSAWLCTTRAPTPHATCICQREMQAACMNRIPQEFLNKCLIDWSGAPQVLAFSLELVAPFLTKCSILERTENGKKMRWNNVHVQNLKMQARSTACRCWGAKAGESAKISFFQWHTTTRAWNRLEMRLPLQSWHVIHGEGILGHVKVPIITHTTLSSLLLWWVSCIYYEAHIPTLSTNLKWSFASTLERPCHLSDLKRDGKAVLMTDVDHLLFEVFFPTPTSFHNIA